MTAVADRPVWLVAVDDDPTGCQSVSGVPLLTAWDHETLTAAARRRAPVTFVLTNSRSMAEEQAVRVNREVGAGLARVAAAEHLRLRVISRSDSTLRGHFPAEVDALADAATIHPHGVVICPAFFEAGRFTANGIHWVHRDGQLVSARDTEFAKDATFGFSELTLADWARARGTKHDVIDIGLDELARNDVDSITAKLADADDQAIVVNAVNHAHLNTFNTAARQAEHLGHRFVYRTGPSFVRAAAGLDAPALADFEAVNRGVGLVVVGSHTDVTNAQVTCAVAAHQLDVVELDAASVLDPQRASDHVAGTAASVTRTLATRSVVLRTSRSVIVADDARTPLEISRTIADAVTETVRQIASSASLGWVVAKGGITSHELLTTAFGVRTAEVIGPALPGLIPVLDIEVGTQRLPYVIFPGNVGDEHALKDVLDRITSA